AEGLCQRYDGRGPDPGHGRGRRLGRDGQFSGRLRCSDASGAPQHPRHPGRGRGRAASSGAAHLVRGRHRRVPGQPPRGRRRVRRGVRGALPGHGAGAGGQARGKEGACRDRGHGGAAAV
ncbi:MAG: RidA/YER057c/UK114 superfamily protein, partial [uncultured Microvirga sp.]